MFQTTKKSALLTAAKKAKLRSRPSRVRFAEGVVINGSPLYSSDLEGSPIPNVMKVFLENGHTKSFKYDNSTSVASVLDVLKEKVSSVSSLRGNIERLRRLGLSFVDVEGSGLTRTLNVSFN